jgi:glutamate 5-kinase
VASVFVERSEIPQHAGRRTHHSMYNGIGGFPFKSSCIIIASPIWCSAAFVHLQSMNKPILVVKFGSAVLAGKDGRTNTSIIRKIADEISILHQHYTIILVSSGAVSSGKHFLKDYKGTLTEKKAAAAIGNPILINYYQNSFSKHGITVAQALCERHHFSNRHQFLQMKNTFEEFWKNKIIPVVNENDLISNNELKFSDNDELATLLAIGFNAEKLIICTSSNGFLDADKKIIPVVNSIDEHILSFISSEKSSVGLGGMLSKITFTQLATSLGIEVYISGLTGKEPLKQTLALQKGTFFKPKKSNLKERQKWLMSGSVTVGQIHVDSGAEKALLNRKSLLTVGITKTAGQFNAGQVIQIMNHKAEIIGVAKAKLSNTEVIKNKSTKNIIAAHADDIVLF